MAEFTIINKDLVHYVEVILNNETIRTESGALRYMRGNVVMEAKMPSVGGFIKSRLTGEHVFRPTYSGTGKVVLEPSFYEFFKLALNNETYVLDRGAYWASDGSVEVSATLNKVVTGLMSGEGLIQTTVRGTGTVIVAAPGPVEIIDLQNDRLVVDGSFAVARSAGLKFSTQTATRSLLGTMVSSEILVNVFEGTGRVYIAPVPNHTVMLQTAIDSTLRGYFVAQKK